LIDSPEQVVLKHSIRGIIFMNTNTSFPVKVRIGSALAMLALVPALSACNQGESDKTVGQKLDSAVAQTERAAADVKDAAKASALVASGAAKDIADQAKVVAKNATTDIAINTDDAAITASVAAGLIKDPDLSALKIDVDTKNAVVYLYGPAPTEAAKARATDIAKAVKGVASVDNKLTVKVN
jgi:hyperosmotically inducible periplasmic protein